MRRVGQVSPTQIVVYNNLHRILHIFDANRTHLFSCLRRMHHKFDAHDNDLHRTPLVSNANDAPIEAIQETQINVFLLVGIQTQGSSYILLKEWVINFINKFWHEDGKESERGLWFVCDTLGNLGSL